MDGGRTPHSRLGAAYAGFCREFWPLILVAEKDGHPRGWGAREHGDNYISDLWIAPEAQGSGIGSALLAALENDIRSAGHGSAELETNAVNAAALRFYAHHGYTVVWTGEKFAPVLGYSIDKVRLSKRFEG